jgi:hypothetical protein
MPLDMEKAQTPESHASEFWVLDVLASGVEHVIGSKSSSRGLVLTNDEISTTN